MLYASVLPQCNHDGSDTDSIGHGKHSLALALTISKAVKKTLFSSSSPYLSLVLLDLARAIFVLLDMPLRTETDLE